jgi:hypothetical protein
MLRLIQLLWAHNLNQIIKILDTPEKCIKELLSIGKSGFI